MSVRGRRRCGSTADPGADRRADGVSRARSFHTFEGAPCRLRADGLLHGVRMYSQFEFCHQGGVRSLLRCHLLTARNGLSPTLHVCVIAQYESIRSALFITIGRFFTRGGVFVSPLRWVRGAGRNGPPPALRVGVIAQYGSVGPALFIAIGKCCFRYVTQREADYYCGHRHSYIFHGFPFDEIDFHQRSIRPTPLRELTVTVSSMP